MEIDFLSGLIDTGILIAFVGIIEAIKSIIKEKTGAEPENKLFLIIFLGCLSLVVGFFIALQNGAFDVSILSGIGTAFLKFIIYFGISTVFYKLIKKWIQKKTDE